MDDVTITTTDGLKGESVTEYLGIVSGEAVIGANVVSDFAAGIRDIVGGRSGSYEKKIERGCESARSFQPVRRAQTTTTEGVTSMAATYE
ncbi:YbjQ family protein [Halorientalis brevis]|uniref:YbjQ family protein n=1 Tax=Halorientalis brevis TaxID=1126241 RepID=A0ABD6CAA9_9EURY|nr:heavy metal-binding domain-containing protein [Halorientalis brevis]